MRRSLLVGVAALLCLTGAADARRTADQALAVAVDGPGTIAAAGIACRDQNGDCVELYADGTPVTLTASPDSGATFAGWGGDCSAATGTTCTLAMSSAKAVTAAFAPAEASAKPDRPAAASPTSSRPASPSRATFAAHSLGRPLVVRASIGWAVTLRFFTSRPARGFVRLSLNGNPVGAFTFSPPRGGVLVGPFRIDRAGAYRFLLTLTDRGGAVARLGWNLAL